MVSHYLLILFIDMKIVLISYIEGSQRTGDHNGDGDHFL